MSILELEEMAAWADLMPFCPAKLEPVIPLPVGEMDEDVAMPEPRVWSYRICGM